MATKIIITVEMPPNKKLKKKKPKQKKPKGKDGGFFYE
jgi:hypothetical protein